MVDTRLDTSTAAAADQGTALSQSLPDIQRDSAQREILSVSNASGKDNNVHSVSSASYDGPTQEFLRYAASKGYGVQFNGYREDQGRFDAEFQLTKDGEPFGRPFRVPRAASRAA